MRRITFSLFALIFCFITITLSGCSMDTVECPDFVGKSYDYVSTSEQYNNFKFEPVYVESDKDDDGAVLAQNIAAGEKIKHGKMITLTVSKGRKKATIPNAQGLDMAAAEKLITDAGFKAQIVYAASSDYAEGICYGTTPAADKQAAIGSSVNVCISLGSEKKLIKHISVVGKTEQDAKDAILKAGLNVGKITYLETTKFAAGTVIEQYPGYAPSLEILEGSLVNLTVAK